MTQEEKNMGLDTLLQPIHRGANWFYWIVGLSLVNATLALFDANLHFIVGLAYTEIASGIIKAADDSIFFKLFGGVSLLMIIGAFLFIGKKAHKPNKTLYLVGIILYALDGVIYFAFSDFLPGIFHIYVVYNLWLGYRAINDYEQWWNQPVDATIEVINEEVQGALQADTIALQTAGGTGLDES